MRLSSIGDVVHALPVAAALRSASWEVGWLVEPPARPLLEGNPAVSRVVTPPPRRAFGPAAAWRAARELRRERVDVALDLQGLWKSAAWARLSGARRVVGYAGPARREPLSALLVGERLPRAEGAVHVIDLNLALLRALGIEAVGRREFPLPPPGPAQAVVEEGLTRLGLAGFVVLNPGGGWASKLWPAERFAELARLLGEQGLRCLVTWGPGEEGLARAVAEGSGGAAVACFPTGLLDLLELLRRARLVVAADTGPLHMACAVGTPVVGLYGPTDPARNGPFRAADRVVRRVPPCAPCHRRQCATHAGVVGGIAAAEVLAACEERLAEAS